MLVERMGLFRAFSSENATDVPVTERQYVSSVSHLRLHSPQHADPITLSHLLCLLNPRSSRLFASSSLLSQIVIGDAILLPSHVRCMHHSPWNPGTTVYALCSNLPSINTPTAPKKARIYPHVRLCSPRSPPALHVTAIAAASSSCDTTRCSTHQQGMQYLFVLQHRRTAVLLEPCMTLISHPSSHSRHSCRAHASRHRAACNADSHDTRSQLTSVQSTPMRLASASPATKPRSSGRPHPHSPRPCSSWVGGPAHIQQLQIFRCNLWTTALKMHLRRSSSGAEFTQYSSHAKEELTRLRGMLNASQEEQTRQAEVLDAVNDAVKSSGAALEGLDLKSDDIAAELRRGAVSNEAMARSVMSLQFFLAAVAEGSVTDREQALAMLKQSFHEQAATLPSVQEQGAPPQASPGHRAPPVAPSPARFIPCRPLRNTLSCAHRAPRSACGCSPGEVSGGNEYLSCPSAPAQTPVCHRLRWRRCAPVRGPSPIPACSASAYTTMHAR